MSKIDIIVPTYNQEDYTVRCFETIRQFTKNYRLIWVDNGSTLESREIVLNELQNHSDYKVIFVEENLGFVGATNLGIKEAKISGSEYVVLLNNDTEVTESWADILLYNMKIDLKLMAVGPMTDTSGSWQGYQNVRKNLSFPNLDGKNKDERAKILKNAFNYTIKQVPMVAFFCTMFRKSIFEKLGELDSRFGIGFGDDDDMCRRIIKAGYRIGFIPGCFVHHNHRTTFRANYTQEQITLMQDHNLGEYFKKHNIRK